MGNSLEEKANVYNYGFTDTNIVILKGAHKVQARTLFFEWKRIKNANRGAISTCQIRPWQSPGPP
jgi:hypothetical protein